MSRWVDFRELRQGLSIEQVLTSYRVPLQRVGLHQLRGPCPLPTHGSERSRNSFSVDTAKNVWACHSPSCCEARQGRVGGNVLDLVSCLEGCSLRQAALRLQEEWRGAGMPVGEPQRRWSLISAAGAEFAFRIDDFTSTGSVIARFVDGPRRDMPRPPVRVAG